MKGVSLKAVTELLGHTSLKMVNVYLHLSEEYKKSAVELLDED
jgi:site-specific recombinase XerD